MKRRITFVALAAAIAVNASASGQTANTSSPSAAPPPPYLSEKQRPDTSAILDSAPQAGSLAYEYDRAVFRATRALKDSPLWELAIRDVKFDLPTLMSDFDCALGVKTDVAALPALVTLLRRSLRDTFFAMDAPKRANQRARPFTIDNGPVCEPLEHLTSDDFPSGHSSFGWTVGLILAELAPDHATEILVRARVYAMSRVVCGAHNQSAIEAGKTIAASVVAVLHSSPEFVADLAAARTELATFRARAAANAESCHAETELLAQTRGMFDKPPY
jgi:acid phosphatase (class A)